MNEGQLPINQLHDMNWGARDAMHVTYYSVCECVWGCMCVCVHCKCVFKDKCMQGLTHR